MDPFSLTTGAIGLVNAASQAVSGLSSFIDTLRSASEIRASTREELHGLSASLANLEGSLTAPVALQDPGLTAAIRTCKATCEHFLARLDAWTRRSTPSRLANRDRLMIALHSDEIEKLHTRVARSIQVLGVLLSAQHVAQLIQLQQQMERAQLQPQPQQQQYHPSSSGRPKERVWRDPRSEMSSVLEEIRDFRTTWEREARAEIARSVTEGGGTGQGMGSTWQMLAMGVMGAQDVEETVGEIFFRH